MRDLAYAEGPGAKLPTVRELCASLGTHPPALDGALTLLETQHIVVRKHGHGIYVSPRVHRKTIAVLLDSSFFQSPGISPFWGMLYGILAREAEMRMEDNRQDFEFHMTAWTSGPDNVLPFGVMNSLQSGAIHGVLGIGLSNEAAAWLTERKIPFVAYGGRAPWVIKLDYDECYRLAIRSLAARGCQRVGCWSSVSSISISNSIHQINIRNENVMEWYPENGLTVYPELLRPGMDHLEARFDDSPYTNQQQGYDLAMSVFGSQEGLKPDGLYIDDDMVTNGALIALQRLGVCVGQDVKIATHANVGSTVLFGHEDQLTLIEIDPRDIVQEMFRMLDSLLADSESIELSVLVTPKLRQ